MNRLVRILSLKRGHGSVGERILIDTVLSQYTHTTICHPETGEAIAYTHVTDPASKTLFCAHIDTVHPADAGIHNPVIFDPAIQLCYKKDGTPLGADDGAGVWLLLEMIDAGVPGTYVFTRGEERGGIGASALADHFPEFLAQFDRAIAFDRRGTTSVITHQGWGECASQEFAYELAQQLGTSYVPDDTGIYTDTAEWVRIIPECTNISVGYEAEHSANEVLDVAYLMDLRSACINTVSWEDLPTVRDPKEEKSLYEYDPRYGPADEYDLATMTYRQIVKWVTDSDPRDVADMLTHLSDQLVSTVKDTPSEADYTGEMIWHT